MTAFAVNPVSVNPKSINPVNVLKFEQQTIEKSDSKTNLELHTWKITCIGSGNPKTVEVETNTQAEAAGLANQYCGSRGWYMGRQDLTISME